MGTVKPSIARQEQTSKHIYSTKRVRSATSHSVLFCPCVRAPAYSLHFAVFQVCERRRREKGNCDTPVGISDKCQVFVLLWVQGQQRRSTALGQMLKPFCPARAKRTRKYKHKHQRTADVRYHPAREHEVTRAHKARESEYGHGSCIHPPANIHVEMITSAAERGAYLRSW